MDLHDLRDLLSRDGINHIFDLLDLFIVRLTLLCLLVAGAYYLVTHGAEANRFAKKRPRHGKNLSANSGNGEFAPSDNHFIQ